MLKNRKTFNHENNTANKLITLLLLLELSHALYLCVGVNRGVSGS